MKLNKSASATVLSRFSHVRLHATPWTAAYQAFLSMGFSRQEHWRGLPFPSPMHESGKWKWSCSVVSDSWRPRGLQPTRLLHPWDFPGRSTGVGCHCLLPFNNIGKSKLLFLSKGSPLGLQSIIFPSEGLAIICPVLVLHNFHCTQCSIPDFIGIIQLR